MQDFLVRVPFMEAVDYLYNETYLTKEDSETLLKTVFQIQTAVKGGQTTFKKGIVREVVEEVKNDYSLYYLELKIPMNVLKRLKKQVNSEVPHLS